MPNVTTYIRKEDWDLWAACPNKAELIHRALHYGAKRKYDDIAALDFSKDKPPLTQDRSYVEPEKILQPRVKAKIEEPLAKCLRHHVPFKFCEAKH